MIPKTIKAFVLLASLTASWQFIDAGEPTFPRPTKQKQEQKSLLSSSSLSPATLLNPAKVVTSMDSVGERWRVSATAPKNGDLQLILTTGKSSQQGNRPVSKIWASYSQDWNSILEKGRSLTFRYTFGQSTVGLQTTFRFGCTDLSRKSSELEDTALTLVYGGTACRFSIDGNDTSGDLPKPVNAGTEVVVEITPAKLATVSVGDTLILKDQPLDFSECFVTFISDSSVLKGQNSYSDLRISRFSVEQD